MGFDVLKNGTRVSLAREANRTDARELTIAGRERHEGEDFYRVLEIPGALFLRGSLQER